jgi:hypothetical protein
MQSDPCSTKYMNLLLLKASMHKSAIALRIGEEVKYLSAIQSIVSNMPVDLKFSSLFSEQRLVVGSHV